MDLSFFHNIANRLAQRLDSFLWNGTDTIYLYGDIQGGW